MACVDVSVKVLISVAIHPLDDAFNKVPSSDMPPFKNDDVWGALICREGMRRPKYACNFFVTIRWVVGM